MFTISTSCYQSIITYFESELPNEGCGIVATSNTHNIDHFFPIINNHPNPSMQFQFEPQSWIETAYHLEEKGLTCIGYVHSHPNEAPIPSIHDLIGITDEHKQLIGIVSFKLKNSPQMKWYQFSDTNQLIDYPLMLT